MGGVPGTSAADAFLKALRCVSRAWCAVAHVRAANAATLLLEATREGAKSARARICDSIMLQLRERAMPNHDLRWALYEQARGKAQQEAWAAAQLQPQDRHLRGTIRWRVLGSTVAGRWVRVIGVPEGCMGKQTQGT